MVDVFSKYKKVDVALSMLALGRLQERQRQFTNYSAFPLVDDDDELIEDLARYAVFSNAAYGWKMELAFGSRFNSSGHPDLHTVMRKTNIAEDDVIASKWEARAHKPAYFIVRDRQKKKIVFCARGTWSHHDILTDLCFTADELEIPERNSYFSRRRRQRIVRAHHGMIEAARNVQQEVEDILIKEREANPDYKLVLVAHSMGGGVCSLLGALWEALFPDLKVYIYGSPCVVPMEYQQLMDSNNIISVIAEDDPFSCLSLGHVADVSSAVGFLCENEELRGAILKRTNRPPKQMTRRDVDWCSGAMEKVRSRMTNEKLFPPGKILLLRSTPAGVGVGNIHRRNRRSVELRDVPAEFFEDLWIRPRMFDLTVHVPFMYVSTLRKLADNRRR